MICHNCGNFVREGNSICPNCGYVFSITNSKQYENSVKTAMELEKSGDYEKAVLLFIKCTQFDNDNHITLIHISLCQKALGYYNDAIDSLRAAVNKNPDSWLAWITLCDCLAEVGKFNEAMDCYLHAYNMDDANGGALTLSLENLQEKMEKAGHKIERPKENNQQKEKSYNYYQKTLQLEKHGKYKDAITNCRKAILYDKDNVEYKVKLKELEKLVENNEKNNKIKEESHNYYQNVLKLEKEGNYEEALSAIKKAIEINPNNPVYNNKLKKLEEKLNKTPTLSEDEKNIITRFNELIELEPENKKYYEDKARYLHEIERYNEEIKCWDELIELDPDNIAYYELKIACLNQLEKYEEEIECYNKLIKIDPENSANYQKEIKKIKELEENSKKKSIETKPTTNKTEDIITEIIKQTNTEQNNNKKRRTYQNKTTGNVTSNGEEKSLILALILSFFICGLGNLINGLNKRAIISVILYIIIFICTYSSIGAFLIIAYWVYTLYDTYACNKAVNEGTEIPKFLFIIDLE